MGGFGPRPLDAGHMSLITILGLATGPWLKQDMGLLECMPQEGTAQLSLLSFHC